MSRPGPADWLNMTMTGQDVRAVEVINRMGNITQRHRVGGMTKCIIMQLTTELKVSHIYYALFMFILCTVHVS